MGGLVQSLAYAKSICHSRVRSPPFNSTSSYSHFSLLSHFFQLWIPRYQPLLFHNPSTSSPKTFPPIFLLRSFLPLTSQEEIEARKFMSLVFKDSLLAKSKGEVRNSFPFSFSFLSHPHLFFFLGSLSVQV